jgi:hypothetical protein
MTSYKIFAFTWNTESVRLSESTDPSVILDHRSKIYGWIPSSTWLYQSHIADFIYELQRIITQEAIDIVCISFQEDAYPGSYFHSDLLPNEIMPSIGYKLIKRHKTIGLGKTTVKSLLQGSFTERGLRMSVYVRSELYDKIMALEDTMPEYDIKEYYYIYGGFTNESLNLFNVDRIFYETIAGKGAININLFLPDVGWVSFMNAHLPFDAKSLIRTKQHQDPMIRQTALLKQNECFNTMVRELILNDTYETFYGSYKKIIPTFAIIMGDLNYRIQNPTDASIIADRFLSDYGNPAKTVIHEYLHHDELRIQMAKNNIYTFNEGINNTGPLFEPTAKMVQGRPSMNSDTNYTGQTFWKTGKWNQRIPSWCDRILYGPIQSSSYKITCEVYNRFDIGSTIKLSDHCAVYGIYIIQPHYQSS